MVDGFNKVKTFDLRNNQNNSSKNEVKDTITCPSFFCQKNEETKIVWKISYNKDNSWTQNVVPILFVHLGCIWDKKDRFCWRMRLCKINKKGFLTKLDQNSMGYFAIFPYWKKKSWSLMIDWYFGWVYNTMTSPYTSTVQVYWTTTLHWQTHTCPDNVSVSLSLSSVFY